MIETDGVKAWRIITLSACFLKDKAQAVEGHGHPSDENKQFTRYVCHRNGIEL